MATRSASSCSPIAAAIAPRPARARRNPRLVGCRPSGRSPTHASRWRAGRRGRGGTRRGSRRSARCRRGRRSPSSAHASRNRGHRAATSATAARQASPSRARASSSAARAAGSAGGRTVVGSPPDMDHRPLVAHGAPGRRSTRPPAQRCTDEPKTVLMVRCSKTRCSRCHHAAVTAIELSTVRNVALGIVDRRDRARRRGGDRHPLDRRQADRRRHPRAAGRRGVVATAGGPGLRRPRPGLPPRRTRRARSSAATSRSTSPLG